MTYYIFANGVQLDFDEINDGVFVCTVGREKMLALRNYKHPVFEQSVWDLGLSVRASNCLRSEDIETIGQLIERLRDNPFYLKKVPNVGKITEREIKDALRAKGLSWGEEA
jgi:DNA-directed RNA polymerase alpha subunit